MGRREGRELTGAEWLALSPGLREALAAAGARPRIIARASWPGRVARLWRGRTPITTLGQTIYWPGAPDDLSSGRAMAVLQHELQHVLDFATGALTRLGYLLTPSDWRYGYRLAGAVWGRLGAEQRASVAEHLWLAERGLADFDLPALRRLAPWAREGDGEGES